MYMEVDFKRHSKYICARETIQQESNKGPGCPIFLWESMATSAQRFACDCNVRWVNSEQGNNGKHSQGGLTVLPTHVLDDGECRQQYLSPNCRC